MGFLRGTPNEDQVYGVNPAEGRGRMLEGMDLILKAMTEPEPFAWEGQYYQYRTVAVWPRPVQTPSPAALVATRSDDAVLYAAEHQLGLGVSFIPVEETGQITDKYVAWCNDNGWQPQPDQMVYRGSIYLAETDALAQEWFDRQTDQGRAPGMALRSSVSQVIQATRAGQEVDYRNVFAGSASGDIVGGAPGLTFVGGPDKVFNEIKAYHDRCGMGVIDLFFQQPSLTHADVMQEIDLFGREVLPRLKEL